MSAGEKEGLELLYSSICLNFIQTTAKTKVTEASPQPAHASRPGLPMNPTRTAQFKVVINHVIQAEINRIQTAIDAKALNICGISQPPL